MTATSQAHEIETISQAGSSPSNNDCASPMLLRAGLGSDSLTGSSKHHWGNDRRLPSPCLVFLQNPGTRDNAKVPYRFYSGRRPVMGTPWQGGVSAPQAQTGWSSRQSVETTFRDIVPHRPPRRFAPPLLSKEGNTLFFFLDLGNSPIKPAPTGVHRSLQV